MSMTTPFQQITKHLVKLDELREQGWEIILNELEDRWHAGFCHKSAKAVKRGWVQRAEGSRVVTTLAPHRYHIHAQGETLEAAILEGFRKIERLTSPVKP